MLRERGVRLMKSGLLSGSRLGDWSRRWKAPLAIGLGLFALFPSTVAHSDLATFLAGLNRKGGNPQMVMTPSPAGSIHEVEIAFNDPVTTGGLDNGGGLVLPDGTMAAVRNEHKGRGLVPDEDRVTRGQKKGRIISVAPVTPPKDFTAGSVLDRTSSLLSPVFDGKERMAFVDPKIKGKEIAIATAFYKKKPLGRDTGIPAVLAGLVTNDRADILATAYARPGPDYARESPFDSILRAEKENDGRFIPTIAPEDHAWAATVLPETVFSAAEQKCLTSGIYFEARGEELKGQAAVAQVILNRVRNPSYPSTICGVVYQNQHMRNRCQFSFACDRIPDVVLAPWHWKTAKEIALAVTAGKIWLEEVGSSTHYHATYVNPAWARSMTRVGKIGLHIFYRTHGGGWS